VYLPCAVKLTSEARLDEEHFRLSTQTFTVDVIEIFNNIENADWLGIACVQHSELAVSQEAADECIIVGMVTSRRCQKQRVQQFQRQIIVNLHVKLQVLKQPLQSFCQIAKNTDLFQSGYLLAV